MFVTVVNKCLENQIVINYMIKIIIVSDTQL